VKTISRPARRYSRPAPACSDLVLTRRTLRTCIVFAYVQWPAMTCFTLPIRASWPIELTPDLVVHSSVTASTRAPFYPRRPHRPLVAMPWRNGFSSASSCNAIFFRLLKLVRPEVCPPLESLRRTVRFASGRALRLFDVSPEALDYAWACLV